MEILLVSHFHWDREWYRPFEAFRARLVDAVDRVLELLEHDPEFRFLLDGQAIVLEDYLEIRPERHGDIERAVRAGRLAVGPWFVQPDSLLPSGETHVRNLLMGRRVAGAFGPVSTIAYVPDSFGHPAQFPQLFAGFGLGPFVYWRGNGQEFDELGPIYRWVAPDGTAMDAACLAAGYFDAACLPADPEEAARRLAPLVADRRQRGTAGGANLLFMNGIDHMLPDAHVGAVAEALTRITGLPVRRGFLDDLLELTGSREALASMPASEPVREHRGELRGGRVANLLPGVWSARMPLKLANRRCETELLGWAEPWSALAGRLGFADERPALSLAWRSLLQNQAHDSIGGCSIDAVHERMRARFDDALGLARETARRSLERLAGLGLERQVPWSTQQEIVVFNPSPHPRTDLVRIALDPFPPMRMPLGFPDVHPLGLFGEDPPGFTVDGVPLRVISAEDPARMAWVPGTRPVDVELVARDVPAFGCRRFRIEPAPALRDEVDAGDTIETAEVRVRVASDGTLSVRFGGDGAHEYTGLFGIEDTGDRGDSYDYDRAAESAAHDVGAVARAVAAAVAVRRWRHPSGLCGLSVIRTIELPDGLAAGRDRRSDTTVPMDLVVDVRLAPGTARVDATVRFENRARDHRLRLLFPTPDARGRGVASTTFDAVERTAQLPDASRWVHPAGATFPHQGWVASGGLLVCAPGLAEAEITREGTIAITLLRSVGWLARFDLASRPIPAGPPLAVEGAQCLGPVEAELALLPSTGTEDSTRARDAELGLRGVIGSSERPLEDGRSLLAIEPRSLLASAIKPAEHGDGIVVRVVNPSDRSVPARITPGFPFRSVRLARLDEEGGATGNTEELRSSEGTVDFEVPPRAMRTILFA